MSNDGRVVTPQNRIDVFQLVSSLNWYRTNANELWDMGLDFGEDEMRGHVLEWKPGRETGDILVRVSWLDGDDKKSIIVLHIFPACNSLVNDRSESRHVELAFYES